MISRALKVTTLLACLGAAAPALAQDQPTPQAVDVVTLPGLGTATVLTYKVQFVSADPATRRVVLETPAGLRWAVIAPPLVGDLGYFRVGETLLIRKMPGVVTGIGKVTRGQPGEVLDEVVVNAGLPGAPEGFGAREVTLAAPVVSVDAAAGTVSFPGADGYLRTLKAANDEVLRDLKTLKPGTLHKISYIEGLALNAMR